ncbi:MAG: NAD-dependent malic enzyme [Planctomycetota bacterium]
MSELSPSYAITIRLKYQDLPAQLGRITTAIGEAGGDIGAVDIVSIDGGVIMRDITVNARDVEHGTKCVDAIREIDSLEVINVSDRVFLMHLGGKIEISPKAPVKTRDDLSMAYTPGVARVCRSIAADEDASFSLTIRKNTVAVVSDGSAVLGLGNIGPRAAMPVMEGKAMLFKEFGGVDAFPICLDTQDTDAIVETVRQLAPTFGGVNLEDISAPRCIEIEQRLEKLLDIPVFHDDQHGTAIVVLAGLMNAMRLVQKDLTKIRIIINGSGAAGTAIAKLLMVAGARDIVVCDTRGALHQERSPDEMNNVKQWLADNTNPESVKGSLSDCIRGADVFIGVSVGNVLSPAVVKSMAADSIVFALANPDPEINPRHAEGVRIMATGRSDFPNQINNVLCFPGLFRGLLDVRATGINDTMKLAAAQAIADVIDSDGLREDYIIPSVFDRRVASVVAQSIAATAAETGVARKRRRQPYQIL